MKISRFEDYHGYPDDLAMKIDQPDFVYCIQQFLHAQEHSDFDFSASQAPTDLPQFDEKITAYPSAVATLFSPSDISGIGGMHCERIHAVDSWRKGPPWNDCIFVEMDLNSPGILGLDIACVQLFFAFTHNNAKYSCTLVHWFSHMSESVDSSTGMWVVECEVTNDGRPITSVIHLNTII